jgi:hypothetical protein
VLAGRTARKPRAATPRLAACLVAILTDESMLNGGEKKEERKGVILCFANIHRKKKAMKEARKKNVR